MSDSIIKATAFLILVMSIAVFTGCEREERQAELEAIKEQIQEKEQEDGETKENEQKYKAALEKSLNLCKGIKWLFEQKAVSEPEGDAEYHYIRKRCFDEFAGFSKYFLDEVYGRMECPESRILRAFISPQVNEKDCIRTGTGSKYSLEGLWELFRKEAIKSGRWEESGNPGTNMYGLFLILHPDNQVTEDDLAPIIVTAMKQGIWRIGVLPPLTPEEKKKLFGPLNPQDDPDLPEVLEPERGE